MPVYFFIASFSQLPSNPDRDLFTNSTWNLNKLHLAWVYNISGVADYSWTSLWLQLGQRFMSVSHIMDHYFHELWNKIRIDTYPEQSLTQALHYVSYSDNNVISLLMFLTDIVCCTVASLHDMQMYWEVHWVHMTWCTAWRLVSYMHNVQILHKG